MKKGTTRIDRAASYRQSASQYYRWPVVDFSRLYPAAGILSEPAGGKKREKRGLVSSDDYQRRSRPVAAQFECRRRTYEVSVCD